MHCGIPGRHQDALVASCPYSVNMDGGNNKGINDTCLLKWIVENGLYKG